MSTPEPIDPMVWRVTGVAMLGPFMTSLDSTVVNVSLNALSQELHTSVASIQWVTTAYLLALALTLPLSGWLVDRVGAKRVYLGCFSVFTATSVLCGTANSVEGLIFDRVLQGAAGGLLAPMAQMVIARVAGRQMGRVIGSGAAAVMLGPIMGPTLAGFLLEHASWRWIFFINLPIGAIAMILAWRVLARDAHETNPRSFDLVGYGLLAVGLVTGLHSLEQLGLGAVGSAAYQVELLASVVFLAGFAMHARRLKGSAIVDIGLFRSPNFSSAASTQFLSNFVSLGAQLIMPLYLLTVAHQSPSRTGLLLAPIGLGMVCSFASVGGLTERFGPRRIATIGAMLALIGTVPFALFGETTLPTLVTAAFFFVRGVGLGSLSIPSMSSAYTSLTKAQIPVATTALNIAQRLGGPVGTTFLAMCLHFGMSLGSTPRAFVLTFWALCGAHGLCLISASRLPRAVAVAQSPTLVEVSAE